MKFIKVYFNFTTFSLLQYAAFLLLVFLLEAVIGILAYIYEANVSIYESLLILVIVDVSLNLINEEHL